MAEQTLNKVPEEELLRMTADVVAAYVSNNTLPTGQLADVISTVYSSLEPCSHRGSHPLSCTQLILDAGIPRVVFAWREPPVFVDARGTELLRAAGRPVVEVPELTPEVPRENTYLKF